MLYTHISILKILACRLHCITGVSTTCQTILSSNAAATAMSSQAAGGPSRTAGPREPGTSQNARESTGRDAGSSGAATEGIDGASNSNSPSPQQSSSPAVGQPHGTFADHLHRLQQGASGANPKQKNNDEANESSGSAAQTDLTSFLSAWAVQDITVLNTPPSPAPAESPSTLSVAPGTSGGSSAARALAQDGQAAAQEAQAARMKGGVESGPFADLVSTDKAPAAEMLVAAGAPPQADQTPTAGAAKADPSGHPVLPEDGGDSAAQTLAAAGASAARRAPGAQEATQAQGAQAAAQAAETAKAAAAALAAASGNGQPAAQPPANLAPEQLAAAGRQAHDAGGAPDSGRKAEDAGDQAASSPAQAEQPQTASAAAHGQSGAFDWSQDDRASDSPFLAPAPPARAGATEGDKSGRQAFLRAFDLQPNQAPSADAPASNQTASAAPDAAKTQTGQVMDQIAQGVQAQAGRDGRQIVIHLNPPELGNVRMTFRAEADGVRCSLQVDNAHTFQQIQHEAPALAGRLAEGGVHVKGIDISIREPADSAGTGSHSMLQDGSAGRQPGNGQNPWQQNPWQQDAHWAQDARRQPADAVAKAGGSIPSMPSRAGDGAVNVWR
jgi:flagellar hook-length control protein FliK